MNTPPILGEQCRCVIYCSRANFNKFSNDWKHSLVEPLVESAGGDYDSTSILGIIKGKKKVFIAFDYNNPEHINTCRVLGFRVKRPLAFKLTSMPADYINSTISRWLVENERWGISFPREGEVRANNNIKPHSPTSPSPLSAGESAKHDTPKSGQGGIV